MIGRLRPLRPLALLTVLLGGCAEPGSVGDFARWDADLRAAGKLRSDRAAPDAPFTRQDLIRNFARIGFGSEFEIVAGRYVALPPMDSAPLTRWNGPVRYRLFGTMEPEDARTVAGFTARLQEIVGLPFRETVETPNLLVFFLDAPSRWRVERMLRTEPDYAPLVDLFAAWSADPYWPCAAEFYYQAAGHPEAHEIYFGVVYIRDEVRGLSRRSCVEEEIAQTMGLARDDPTVRPSMFNDDEEFALMTDHDAALLALLYDPRLKPGMTLAEATPVIERIVLERAD